MTRQPDAPPDSRKPQGRQRVAIPRAGAAARASSGPREQLPGHVVSVLPDPPVPTVYLIHFLTPIAGRASHYLGWTTDLPARLRVHASGNGSRLMAEVSRLGIGWIVARTWPGNRHLERRLKRRKDAAGLCPVCRLARRQRKTAAQRIHRANRANRANRLALRNTP